MGRNLERGPDEQGQRRKNHLIKAGILLALVAVTVAAFPRTEVYRYAVQVGEVWNGELVVAPFDFAIDKDPEALAAEREAVRRRTPPYFQRLTDAQERMTANRDTVAQQLDLIFEAYADYQFNRQRGRREAARVDSLRYAELRRSARLKLTPEQWRLLAQAYAERVPGLSTSTRETPDGPPIYETLLRQAWEDATTMVANLGVIDIPRDSVLTETIFVRDEDERVLRERRRDNLYGLDEAWLAAQSAFRNQYPDDPNRAGIASAMFRAIFQPSLTYLQAETLREWMRRQEAISPQKGLVAAGTEIVEPGQRVTEEIYQQLRSLERRRAERGGAQFLWKTLLGQVLLTLITYFIFFLYLYLLRRAIFDNNRFVLLIALVLAGVVGLFAVAVRLPELAIYAVPTAIVAVLFAVMFDSRVGIFGAITLALIGGHLLQYDFEFAFATIFAGVLAALSVRDIKNRSQFFVSAGLVFVAYGLVLSASFILLDRSADRYWGDMLQVTINGLLIVMAYPLLWIFERTFDITTDLTLLELSDTNRPLLKELSLRAPGTLNHSLQVANLAEAAADTIGANALLTRVGALYHDIGKMLKPEYFVENQRRGENPHEPLKPRMSALIIASHVKEGLELGRQYNLPQRVLKFIPMHHGTTRIEYFYRKALDQHDESAPPVLDADFRYPGPRPDSKETGILMLADSVEAASRSLSEPTHKRLQTLIEMIFKARIEDGQLSRTDLTFRDLDRIKETFLSILSGIYHTRVKYPGQEEEPEAEAPTPIPEGQRVVGVMGTMEQSIAASGPGDEAAEPSAESSSGTEGEAGADPGSSTPPALRLEHATSAERTAASTAESTSAKPNAEAAESDDSEEALGGDHGLLGDPNLRAQDDASADSSGDGSADIVHDKDSSP